jgi:hypothetical protein
VDKASVGAVFGGIGGVIDRLTFGRSDIFAIAGIAVIGWVLALLKPPSWTLGELILLAAAVLLVREGHKAKEESAATSHGDTFANSKAWFAGSAAWFEGSASYPREVPKRPFGLWDRPDGQSSAIVSPATSHRMSVEQIAHEMLTHAFRQASLKHHPDHGGDPENMRRVYLARDIFLRAIHKT